MNGQSKAIWVIAGFFGVFLCLCAACAVLLGPSFVQGFQEGYRGALATATARAAGRPETDASIPENAAPAAPEADFSEEDAGLPSSTDALALRIHVQEASTGAPFPIRIRFETDAPPPVYLVAFRGEVSLLISAPLSPAPVDYGVEYPQGRRVFLARYSGVQTSEFVFQGRAFVPGRWEGDLVLCFAPDVSPDTCRVVPLTVVVPE